MLQTSLGYNLAMKALVLQKGTPCDPLSRRPEEDETSMRVAVIGLGGIARKAYLPLLGTWEGIELTLCSRTAAHVECLQNKYHLSGGTTHLEDLLACKPQAAFVLTPNESHREIVTSLLQSGIDVFVEKPATVHSAETRGLAELADVRGRILMVGFNRRYAPLHQKARQLWGERPIELCTLEKYRQGAANTSLFAHYVDDTIHLIDLLRFFCGDGQALSSVQQLCEGKLVGAASVIRFPDGGHGLVATCLEAGRWGESYALHGSGASLYINAFSEVRLLTADGEQVWRESGGDWTPMLQARGFAAQIQHFFDCVQSRQQPLTSGWEAFKTQRLVEDLVACVRE